MEKTIKHSFLNRPIAIRVTTREILFVAALSLCLGPWVSPPLALLLGLATTICIGHPFIQLNHKATQILLQASVVGLGFGMNARSALAAGREGFLFTVASITGTLLLGLLAGRLLQTEKKSSWLIACGTAICGGSAIAAISPVIRAEERQVSVAMGTVFLLNAVALFLFPVVGHWLHLSQQQFGLWSAIAIQDTSSVVGAAGKYGPDALQIATTVKLARALWIIPVALVTALAMSRGIAFADNAAPGDTVVPGGAVTLRQDSDGLKALRHRRPRIQIPWFIGLFILAMLANAYLPFLHTAGHLIVGLAKTGLTLTLFLIGAGLSKEAIRATGIRPLIQGGLLWVILSATALIAVMRLG